MSLGEPARGSIDAAVAATPAGRDRWADALRVGSLLVVVLGHWLMVVVTPDGKIGNLLAIVPALQPVTWLLQVMPLFFLVGGVAHAHTLDSLDRAAGGSLDRAPAGGSGDGASGDGAAAGVAPSARTGRYAAFIRSRAARLLRPTFAFLGAWLVLGVLAHLSGLTARGDQAELVRAALVVVPQLLWFVGIYLGIAAFAPAMLRAHRRFGVGVLVTLVAGACVVDWLRFGLGIGLVGNLNFALVWLALHQCGFLWCDGLLTTWFAWLLTLGGTAGLLLAVTRGPYPVSMVGLPGDEVSNMAPPTVALLAQGLALVGLAALLRGSMARALARPRPWRLVVTAGAFAMTAFLWHLTALLVVLLAVRGLGIGLPEPATAAWWWSRPLWFALLAVPTALLVAVFLRFDRGPRRAGGIPAGMPRWADPVAALAAALTVFGVLMVSITGVDVLGNRPQFFLVGEVTPAVALAILAVAATCLAGTGSVSSYPQRRR